MIMKIEFTRSNHQLLLSVVVFTSTMIPMTSALAILPMSSEVFQTGSSAPVFSSGTTLTVKEAISKEEHLKMQNKQFSAFSKKSKFSTLIRESKQFKDIEKRSSDILHN